MKRRNAETGKLRRPMKRTKITEGMYGNSMLYLKFVMLWATVVMADHMLEFRFEFLWPLWMMFRSVYDSFKYQGLVVSVFFVGIALTSDVICFFFIPLQYIFFAASTYVWVQYVWYTFADKGVCLPTMALCCLVVYAEGALRGSGGRAGLDICRPLAAHSVGYPIVTLGIAVKSYVRHELWLHRQRMMLAQEIYQMLKFGAPPAPPPEQNNTNHTEPLTSEASTETIDSRYVNGATRRKKMVNGEYPILDIHEKLEYLTKHLENQIPKKSRDQRPDDLEDNHEPCKMTAPLSQPSIKCKTDKRESCVGSGQAKEERRRNKNKDKDKDADSCKNTEQAKETIFKENIESTKEVVKNHKDNSSSTNRDKEESKREKEESKREKEELKREKEFRERERERDREREREREREQRAVRESAEELRKARAELAVCRAGEAESRAALAAALSDLATRKQSGFRCGEKAALERKLCEERRARSHAETLLRNQHNKNSSNECDNEYCKSRARASHTESSSLRRELQRTREKAARLQHELTTATEQVRTLESRAEESPTVRLAGAWSALQERAQHLERALSSETRVKLDLLSALGDAKRQLRLQESLISRQEKELAELKAQMLAVMPTEYMNHVPSGVSKFRLSDGSPLDPNASVYTPKQLCSDA